MSDSRLLRDLRRELRAAGDPIRAKSAQAYMKSATPFHGVSAVPMRALCKQMFGQLSLPDAATWQREVLALFRGARYREEWYAAVELCADRRARPFQTMDALPLYEELITSAAWWDVVDAIATHRLRDLLCNEPRSMAASMRAWSRDANMWKARSAILCQVGRKRETDCELLYSCIAPSIGSREFFLRKAIGWALRSYAWTDPAEVKRYVEAHPELSGLSVREALKNDGKPSRRSR